MKQGQAVRLSVDMLMAGIAAIEPKTRISFLLAGLVATADELHLEERELLRTVRVALCQRAIAAEVGNSILTPEGRPAMPTGDQPIALGQRSMWECPLCGAQVPPGVKHKHTVRDWMTGKMNQRSVDRIEDGSIGERAAHAPEGEQAEATGGPVRMSLGAMRLAGRPASSACRCQRWPCPCACHRAPGASASEEPPTLDESAKRRERPSCEECGVHLDHADGHWPHCSRYVVPA
jgi:hypothetical protein